ncbi:hypothetical protein BHE74_00019109 [Ensete ventricosum]|nr:hypothetical protein BHE74_00019109 [Ensete ventricosum]
MDPSASPRLERERHLLFLEMMAVGLPKEYETQEINRLTLAYFAISGLSILDALDRVGTNLHPCSFFRDLGIVDKDQVANWVLSFQAHPRMVADLDSGNFLKGGLLYGYLCFLFIAYCWQSYDGGFGLVPGSESHGNDTGGATYCGVAALQLMGFIGADILSKQAQSAVIDMPLLVDWSLKVRCNVNIMGSNERFGTYGGFTKFPENMLPDLYHSYYSFAALSLLGEPGLRPLCVELGITASDDGHGKRGSSPEAAFFSC